MYDLNGNRYHLEEMDNPRMQYFARYPLWLSNEILHYFIPKRQNENCALYNLSYLYGYRNKRITHDDVIKWKHFPRNWPFVRKIHRSPVNFPHKGQWRGALMFSLIYVWINDWANNREAGDLRRYPVHYDVIVMSLCMFICVGGSTEGSWVRVTKLCRPLMQQK